MSSILTDLSVPLLCKPISYSQTLPSPQALTSHMKLLFYRDVFLTLFWFQQPCTRPLSLLCHEDLILTMLGPQHPTRDPSPHECPFKHLGTLLLCVPQPSHVRCILFSSCLCSSSVPGPCLRGPCLPYPVIAAYSGLTLHITYTLLILHWDLLCIEAFLTLLRLQHCAQPPSYTDGPPNPS